MTTPEGALILEGQGAAHPDQQLDFDARLPLDFLHGDERFWLVYVFLWAALALGLGLAAWGLSRPRGGSRLPFWPVFVSGLTLLPSARDWGLVAALLGMFGAWVWLSRKGTVLDRLTGPPVRAWTRLNALPARHYALLLWLSALVAYLLLGWVVFGWIPAIQDSQAQRFQAQLLCSGRFVAPIPAHGDFFLAENMLMHEGKWYSIYPIGHAFWLALGECFGLSFAVNPAMGAATCVMVWALTRQVFDEKSAKIAGLLALVSPFVAYMSAEYMNHASAGLSLVVELWVILRLTRRERPPTTRSLLLLGALAGFAAGALFATRPLTFFAAQLVAGPFLLWSILSRRRWRLLIALCPMAACAVAVLLAQLAYNQQTTGDALVFGHSIAFPNLHYGFVDGPAGLHTPWRGLEFTLRNLNAQNLYLIGLPIPGVALAIFAAARHRHHAPGHHAPVWLLGGVALCSLAIYAGLCFQDLTFGPRYQYEASLALIPLVAKALPDAFRWAGGATGSSPRVARSALAGFAILLLGFLPGLGFYYHRVYGLADGVTARAEAELPPGALVFVEGKYQRAFFAVRPDLGGDILYARDLGPRNAELACSRPDRPAFVERGGRFVAFAPACPPAEAGR